MSEDSLRIELTSEKLQDEKHRAALEATHAQYVTGAGPDSSVDYTGNRASFFSSFYSVDEDALLGLFSDLQAQGVTDLLARVWHDSAGEEVLITVSDGKLLYFESREAWEDHRAEEEKARAGVTLNFGKDERSNTALIRLQVKVTKKREALLELFSSLVRDRDIKSFKAGFQSLGKGKRFDIAWGRFRKIHGTRRYGKWNEVCSDALLHTFVDVAEDEKFLLLALDLNHVSDKPDVPLDDYLYMIFYELLGVSKVWIKYRSAYGPLRYLHHPGMGDEAYFVRKRIPNENDWPKV